MINFESITIKLTEDDNVLLQALVKGFKRHRKDNPVKEKDIVVGMRKVFGKKFNAVKLRRMVNYLRSTGQLAVIGTEKGYYVTEDKQEINKQIQSMNQRAQAIILAANGLKKFL